MDPADCIFSQIEGMNLEGELGEGHPEVGGYKG